MKSRTSCCKAVLLKKDLTRFFPAWALYCVGLLLVFVMPIYSGPSLYERVNELCEMMQIFVVLNFGYALLNAQLLFGDLFNARMTNALHALPVKRDTFFWAHIVAGLLVSLIPNALVTLAVMPALENWAMYSWLWFAAAFLSYFFFYTLAVFCVMLSGNRLGQILLYGITNFFAVLVCWYLTEVYSVLLYGVWLDESMVIQFCPGYAMLTRELVKVVLEENCRYPDFMIKNVQILSWKVSALYGFAGVVLLGASQVLYRLRKLECAGDLLAFGKLKKLFLVLFTLTAGAFFQLFAQLITPKDVVALPFAALLLGMTVGYIAGLMMLKRQLQVFRLRDFRLLGAILAALFVSVGITALDPLGLESYVPTADQVQSIRMADETNGYHNSPRSIAMTDDENIEAALRLQQALIDNHTTQFQNSRIWQFFGIYHSGADGIIAMHYTLKNGKTFDRYYSVAADSPQLMQVKMLMSTPETVMGIHETDTEAFAGTLDSITVYIYDYIRSYNDGYLITRQQDKVDFLRAYIADCREGTTAQPWFLNRTEGDGSPHVGNAYCSKAYILDEYPVGMSLYTTNAHTLSWLEENLPRLELAPRG